MNTNTFVESIYLFVKDSGPAIIIKAALIVGTKAQ